MVRSLRMKALRPGETTGDGAYRVLREASSYPVVSVTPIGQTLLVHAPGGFYAMGFFPTGTQPSR